MGGSVGQSMSPCTAALPETSSSSLICLCPVISHQAMYCQSMPHRGTRSLDWCTRPANVCCSRACFIHRWGRLPSADASTWAAAVNSTTSAWPHGGVGRVTHSRVSLRWSLHPCACMAQAYAFTASSRLSKHSASSERRYDLIECSGQWTLTTVIT